MVEPAYAEGQRLRHLETHLRDHCHGDERHIRETRIEATERLGNRNHAA